MHVCMYVCACACMHACMYVCMHVYMHVHKHVLVCIHTYMRACMHTYLYIYVFIHTHENILCAHIHGIYKSPSPPLQSCRQASPWSAIHCSKNAWDVIICLMIYVFVTKCCHDYRCCYGSCLHASLLYLPLPVLLLTSSLMSRFDFQGLAEAPPHNLPARLVSSRPVELRAPMIQSSCFPDNVAPGGPKRKVLTNPSI